MKYIHQIWTKVICKSCNNEDFELIPDNEGNKTHAFITKRGTYTGEMSVLKCKNCENYTYPSLSLREFNNTAE